MLNQPMYRQIFTTTFSRALDSVHDHTVPGSEKEPSRKCSGQQLRRWLIPETLLSSPFLDPQHDSFTPYNVGSVLWRLFSTLEVVQYIGGITSVLWGIASVLWGDSFSTVEVVQYSGGIASVLWGDSFSTVEVVQYSGEITSVHAGG